jgi:hypothetical protein
MEYNKFESIFNKTIFEKSKPDLISKIANYPERYVGVFRPTKLKTKIIQNLLQSHEIRFGDAFEALIEKYLQEAGFQMLSKSFKNDVDTLEVDQMFKDTNTIYFVEQKIRDDHDSTKKRGQIENFEKKISVITEKYNGVDFVGFFYFIDGSFTKNRNFYLDKIANLASRYGITLHLSYGDDLFQTLNIGNIWDEILIHLKKWKKGLPELPDINFDKKPQISFEEIKDLEPRIFQKLFSNHDLCEVMNVLFPEKATLKLLEEYFYSEFQSRHRTIHKKLRDLCAGMMSKMNETQF